MEIKSKLVEASEAELEYDTGAKADLTKTLFPYFCNNVLHSLFADYTASANGLKISKSKENYAHKSFIETEFSHRKYAQENWLACQGHSY